MGNDNTCPPLATASAVTLAQRRRRTRNKAQEAAPGHAQCRCTKIRGQRGAAAAPGGRTWPATAPPAAPTWALALLRAPLLVPSGASVRGTKPRKLPQAALSAAAPRTGVREEQQPHQRGAPGLRRPPTAGATGALDHPTPRCSGPATPPRVEHSSGSCPRPLSVPMQAVFELCRRKAPAIEHSKKMQL